MVSYEQTHRPCRLCGKPTIHYRKGTNHVLHLLITVFTCGWWAIVWFLMAFKIGGWRCQECGAGSRSAGVIGGAIAVVGAGVMGLAVIGAMSGGGSSSRRSPPPRPASSPSAPTLTDTSADPSPPDAAAVDPSEESEPASASESAAPTKPAAAAATAPEPKPESEPEPEYTVFPASRVYAYYDQNEIRGDAELKGKWFAVQGRISDINKDILGTPYVAFRSDDWIFGVQCMFPRSSASALARLTPGQNVTIAGKCSGKMANVIMTDCRFYSPPAPEPEPSEPKRRQPPPKPKPIVRTWTDSTGQFKIDAEFAGYAAGTVKLKKADGSIITLPMEKLSQEDQDWIRDRR